MAKGKYAKREVKKPFYKKWWFIAFIAVILVGAFGGTDDSDTSTEPTAMAIETTQATLTTVTEASPTESDPAENEDAPLKLQHGELLDVTINSFDNIVVIKAKIQPSYSNNATIHQNYYNVVDLIQNHGFDQYTEVQYWAVADMTDGSEQKVISFTVDEDLIGLITAPSGFAANTLGEYAIDLWILPTLRDN